MLKTANASFMLGTSSWREQFIEALTVSTGLPLIITINCTTYNLGDDDDDDGTDAGSSAEGSEKQKVEPTKYDYFMHFLTVPWKLAFALIPPTDYWQALSSVP